MPCEVTACVAEGNCVAARRGGEQPEAKIARRMTNPLRRRVAASLLMYGEAWTARDRPDARGDNVTPGRTTWLGTGCPEGRRTERRDLRACESAQESEPA